MRRAVLRPSVRTAGAEQVTMADLTAPPIGRPTSRRPRRLALVAIVVVAAVLAAAWWAFLRPDAPTSFAIDAAAASVVEERRANGPMTTEVPTTPLPAPGADLDGTWLVAPASGSVAGFRIVEELARIGVTEAVGRTELVTGSLSITGATITDVVVTVDMASLATDDSHRDSHVRGALATDQFPTATFALTRPVELAAIPAEGETVSVVATGAMTIRGVTHVVPVAIDGRVVDGTLVVVGSLPVRFADYGVAVPRSAAVISVADEGTVEFQLFLSRV